MLDFYGERIYPWPKAQEAVPVPLPPATAGAEYLATLAEYLPLALAEGRPDLVVYNAGADVLAEDRLTSLRLAPADLLQCRLARLDEDDQARGVGLSPRCRRRGGATAALRERCHRLTLPPSPRGPTHEPGRSLPASDPGTPR
jgi:hypothetical protein